MALPGRSPPDTSTDRQTCHCLAELRALHRPVHRDPKNPKLEPVIWRYRDDGALAVVPDLIRTTFPYDRQAADGYPDLVLNPLGLVSAWDCAASIDHDTSFQLLIHLSFQDINASGLGLLPSQVRFHHGRLRFSGPIERPQAR